MIKLTLSTIGVLILATGCTTYNEDRVADSDYPTDYYAVSSSGSRLARDFRQPEPVEITRTQEATATRFAALHRQQEDELTQREMYASREPSVSGRISNSMPQILVEEPGLEVVAERRMPTARRVDGRPGFVTSPYAPNAGFIDVTGMPSGTDARDPYTGRVFQVP